ncbi:MAG: DUF4258 domain-containing protein [Deltaproteobacteria bacterium]|nr:MAG: DUF4258 domain-containing protein [Deltaproteobacteria bacterium]
MYEATIHERNLDGSARLTMHARQRMNSRRLPEAAIRAALEHGRVVHVRGASIYVIGRKEISRYRRRGLDLSSFHGVQVVCSPDGTILTVYRNRDFRSLRPQRRGRRARA